MTNLPLIGFGLYVISEGVLWFGLELGGEYDLNFSFTSVSLWVSESLSPTCSLHARSISEFCSEKKYYN